MDSAAPIGNLWQVLRPDSDEFEAGKKSIELPHWGNVSMLKDGNTGQFTTSFLSSRICGAGSVRLFDHTPRLCHEYAFDDMPLRVSCHDSDRPASWWPAEVHHDERAKESYVDSGRGAHMRGFRGP